MKRLFNYLLPILFLLTACGQGGTQNGENGNGGKGEEAQKNNQASSGKNDKNNQEDESDEVELAFPRPSPEAKVRQTIGITDASVHYYRPSVKGRQIWGKLVPYGEMWRTGANENTVVHFEHDVKVKGNDLAAGKYSFFTIPRKNDKWTLIFNEKTDHWGTQGYEKSNDALRMQVQPQQAEHHHEMMTFQFKAVTDSSAKLVLAWKKTMVPFTLQTATSDHVMANMNRAIEQAGSDDWKVYNESADYLVEKGKMLDKAEEWVNQSIDIEENWRNLWTKAQLMKEKGSMEKAVSIAEKALQVGKENGIRDYYKNYLNENIEEMKNNM